MASSSSSSSSNSSNSNSCSSSSSSSSSSSKTDGITSRKRPLDYPYKIYHDKLLQVKKNEVDVKVR